MNNSIPKPEIPDSEEQRKQKEKRRREYEKKFGYMNNIDGITSVLPEMAGWEIPSDVSGSYTGTGIDDVYPVQDADDL